MRGGSKKGRTPNRSRRGCREIGGGWKGGMGESRNGQPNVLGIRKKGTLLLVTFSNLPSLQMMSAFLLRKAPMPPISHLLSTSHPPLATKAESAKSSRPNKKIPALPMLLPSMASSSLFCSATSFGRLHLRAPPLAHFSRLAFLSSLVKIHWRKPLNFHRFLWNIASTCPSLQLEGFSPSSSPFPFTASPIP